MQVLYCTVIDSNRTLYRGTHLTSISFYYKELLVYLERTICIYVVNTSAQKGNPSPSPFLSSPVYLTLADLQWRLAPTAICQHARILLQAGLLPRLVPVIGGGPRGRRCSSTSQPGCGDGESSGSPTDIQLRLSAGVCRTWYVLCGGGPRPPAVCHPEPPVAARCLRQLHARIGGAVVMGSCYRTKEKERSV